MTVHGRRSGTVRQMGRIFVRRAGTVREVAEVYVRRAGVVRRAFQRGETFSLTAAMIPAGTFFGFSAPLSTGSISPGSSTILGGTVTQVGTFVPSNNFTFRTSGVVAAQGSISAVTYMTAGGPVTLLTAAASFSLGPFPNFLAQWDWANNNGQITSGSVIIHP